MVRKAIAISLILVLVAVLGCTKPPQAPARKPQIKGAIGEATLYTSGVNERVIANAKAQLDQQKKAVYKTIASFYKALYMSPGSIDERALQELFVSATGKRVVSNLADFSLGKVAEDLESVNDGTLTVDPVVFYKTQDKFLAITTVEFKVKGKLKGGSSVLIISKGTFYLIKQEDGWRVFDCELDQSANTAKSSKKSKVKAK